jgi:menaquinone-dependent protoporphyrinogen oxidase
MARVLIVYSTVDGHTPEICARIARQLEERGHDIALEKLTTNSAHDLTGADAILIGASIRYGKHRPEVAKLIEKDVEVLRSRPSAFFSVNAVARKPEKCDAATNPYVRKFLESISWQPALVGVFGGKIDYPKYGALDKTMIRFIMWMTKGPTDPTGTFEFTDWDQVDRFAEAFAAGIGDKRG